MSFGACPKSLFIKELIEKGGRFEEGAKGQVAGNRGAFRQVDGQHPGGFGGHHVVLAVPDDDAPSGRYADGFGAREHRPRVRLPATHIPGDQDLERDVDLFHHFQDMPLRVVRHDAEGDAFPPQVSEQLMRAVVGLGFVGGDKFMFFKDIRYFARALGRERGEVVQNGYLPVGQAHLLFHGGPVEGGFRERAVKIEQHALQGSFQFPFLTALLKLHRNQSVSGERFSRRAES